MSSIERLRPDSIIRRAEGITFVPFDDTLLAVDGASGFCYALNETGRRIWELIDPPALLQAVCDQLCREYQVDDAACLREVGTLLRELARAGVVQVSDGAR